MILAVAAAEPWEVEHRRRAWGRWPDEHFVRFVGRRWGGLPPTDRGAIRFLDLGCGAGANTMFLLKEGFAVVAVDGSPTAIDHVRARAAEELNDAYWLETVCADVVNLPSWLQRETFDCVVDVACLQCLDDADMGSALVSAAGVLRPGGHLFSKHASAHGWPGVHTVGTVFPRRAADIAALYGAVLKCDYFHDQHERAHPTVPGRKVLVAHWIIEGVRA